MTEITPERLAQIKARADIIASLPTAPLVYFSNSIGDIPDLVAALEAAQAENAKLHEAMCIIAMQRLPAEIASDVRQNLDFEEGYSACVETARAALEQSHE